MADNTIPSTITTFKMPKYIHDKIRTYNQKYPNNKINVSEICREAVEQELARRLKQKK